LVFDQTAINSGHSNKVDLLLVALIAKVKAVRMKN